MMGTLVLALAMAAQAAPEPIAITPEQFASAIQGMVGQSYEGGYARKTRSPSLYERYTWSTNGMAMTMNNWLNLRKGPRDDDNATNG